MTRKFLAAALLGGFASAWANAPAFADKATIGFTTYLRDGPGVRYRAVDEVLSDEPVEVLSCANAWCRIAYGGATGFVAQGTLASAMTATPAPSDPQTCFVSRIAGYHGGPQVNFCYSAPR